MEEDPQALPVRDPLETSPSSSKPESVPRPYPSPAQDFAPQLPPLLPGISSLATAPSPASSAQLRASTVSTASYPAGPPPVAPPVAPSASTSSIKMNVPTCQNCSTSITPLWRRDEMGSVLCNACGLFLKLHGRARPISLKTDVIKSRNRVKTMRPDLAKQKKNQLPATTDGHGEDLGAAHAAGTPGGRRTSVKGPGHQDDVPSPISRTATPSMYNTHGLPLYHNMEDAHFQAQSLPGFPVSAASPGRAASPLSGDRFDIPQTQESLIAANASLKTRVSELEVIQALYRGRLQQLETDEANARQAQDISGKAEAQLRSQLEAAQQTEAQLRNDLEESHRRENMLKRRLDELELELKEAVEGHENGRAKKARLDNDGAKAEKEPAPAGPAP